MPWSLILLLAWLNRAFARALVGVGRVIEWLALWSCRFTDWLTEQAQKKSPGF